MQSRVLSGLAVGLALTVAPGLAQEAPIEGTWVTALSSEITILPCPEGYCGFISKIVVPQQILDAHEGVEEMAVESFTDANNKDPALRDRPILGLQILVMRPANQPLVYDGEIYNPEDGNIYSGYIQVIDADTVRLNGCVLFNIICRGEDWVRAIPEELADPAE